MEDSTDVVIIGGGVIGCAIAYYLRKQGVEVTVVERGAIGAEASSAAAGLLAPLGSISEAGPFSDLLLASWSMFPQLAAELEEESGVPLEYAQTGALRVVRNPKNIPNLRKRMEAWRPLGLQMHWLTGDEARQREPLLAPEVCAAIYAPEEAQVKAPRVVQAFAEAASRLGARRYSHREIRGIQQEGARVTAVYLAQGETIRCNRLVVASGSWAAHSGTWLNLAVPVSPQRGQILTLKQPALRHIVFGEAIYLAPKQDGTVVVGATKEDAGFEKQLTAGGISWLLTTASRLVPSLANCALDQLWAGLRPKTPDNQPIIGNLAEWENVTLAVGHGSVGILLSAITGKCVAELMTTHTVPTVIKEFSFERFNDTSK